MADVLKIALDRREALKQELAKLDEFIRMAESLIRGAEGRGDSADARPNQSRRTPDAVA